MAVGISFIVAGILIALFPHLLSIIVAAVLISIGIGAVSFGYRVRKMEKRFDDPFIDFFFRH